MYFPTILHAKNGAKKLVKDEGEYNDAIAAEWAESPADFSPERIKERKEAAAKAKEAAEKKAIEDERIAEGLKLLAEKEKKSKK